MQGRSKECILLRSFTENLEEIRSVSLVRKLIRISVPTFWLGSCPTNFHKIIKNPNVILRRINLTLKDQFISESCIEITIELNFYSHTSL